MNRSNRTDSGIIQHTLVLILITSFIIVSGCGGGGSSASGDGSKTISLGTAGKLKFPVNSLPAGTSVTVNQVDPPIFVNNLDAVGPAYEVIVSNQPTLPVEVTLPVPAGEDPTKLILVRLEDSGRISLLQTSVENGMLKAKTPGFSHILAARLKQLLVDFKPSITGPDIIPTNINGQYSETTLASVPGLPREWRVYEYASSPMQSQLTFNSQPLKNSNVILSAQSAGTLDLMVEYSHPATGLNSIATKLISVQPELEAVTDLDIAVYRPDIVSVGETFNIKAAVLNTNVTDIIKWEWRLGTVSGAPCNTGCTTTFDINNVNLTTVGLNKFTITATSATGLVSTVTFDIMVRAKNIVIVNSNRTPRYSFDIVWDQTTSPNPQVTYDVVIEDGTPPYSFVWKVLPTGETETHNISLDVDSFTATLDQPGSYAVDLTVSDAAGDTETKEFLFSVDGALPITKYFTNLPTVNTTVGQPFMVTLNINGSTLISEGEQFLSYDALMNWGEDQTVEVVRIPAANPITGGSQTAQHTFDSAGTYTVSYGAIPSRTATAGEVIPLLEDILYLDTLKFSNLAQSKVISTTVTVDALSLDWVSPTICTGVTDANYDRKWKANLTVKAPDDVTGTLYFHACPGGGRLAYNLSGSVSPTDSSIYLVTGSRSGGRGGLFDASAATQTFTLQDATAPNPNLAP